MESCGIPNELQSFLNERKQLKLWPVKRKKQLMALWYLAGRLEAGKTYSES